MEGAVSRLLLVYNARESYYLVTALSLTRWDCEDTFTKDNPLPSHYALGTLPHGLAFKTP